MEKLLMGKDSPGLIRWGLDKFKKEPFAKTEDL